uniref:Uncharacterized protein n=1 Tax=Caenorhabditis japonica TaxID=281687 RepID=A0A8R1ESQ8_CAEJA
MKRLFDFSIIKTLWAARLQSIFESIFGKEPVKKVAVQQAIKPSSSTPINPAPIKREMHSSVVVKTVSFTVSCDVTLNIIQQNLGCSVQQFLPGHATMNLWWKIFKTTDA